MVFDLKVLVFDGDSLDFLFVKKWVVLIVFNVVFFNYKIVEEGYIEEEVKLWDEIWKILEIFDFFVLGMCVCVLVYIGYLFFMNVEFEKLIFVD